MNSRATGPINEFTRQINRKPIDILPIDDFHLSVTFDNNIKVDFSFPEKKMIDKALDFFSEEVKS